MIRKIRKMHVTGQDFPNHYIGIIIIIGSITWGVGNPWAVIGILYRNYIGFNSIIISPTGSITWGVGNHWAATGIPYMNTLYAYAI